MKKIILFALCWPVIQMYSPVYAQKEKVKETKRQEIIILKNGDKEKKYTIETKDGEVFINGKPSSEYNDDEISVITGGEGNTYNFTPGSRRNLFNGLSEEKKSFLGVTTEKTDGGVKITNVSKGSAAEKAGLKEGDIITKVGSKAINNPEELMDAVTAYKPKEEVTIYYIRNGKAANIKATLGDRSITMKAFSFNDPKLHNMEMFKEFNFQMPPLPPMPGHPFKMYWGFGQGRLGVKIEDTDNDEGVKIINVEKESVAEKAGLKADDIITEVNGKKVKDVNEIRKELAEVKDKNLYTLKARRNSTDMNFDIKIPKRKNNADL